MVARGSPELQEDLVRLRADLERYRAATQAALETLDAAIGHLERERRLALARRLRSNVASILSHLGSDPRIG